VSYKSTHLLVEAIHKEMDSLHKSLLKAPASEKNADGQDSWIELRKLIDELEAKADRPTIEEVLQQTPADYVATMKPLVARYHQQLMTANLLAPAICEDLRANACVLILIGEGNTVVLAAHDPGKEDVALAVETLLAAVDIGLGQIINDTKVVVEQADVERAPDTES
jgi:hypothetical protein